MTETGELRPIANKWDLHLLRVVIDDGEPERHVGDAFRWLASFWSHAGLIQSTERTRSALRIGGHAYRVNAEIVWISDDPVYLSYILDFGIRSISESALVLHSLLPPGCREGDYVTGELRLESPLCVDVHPYDLNYTWRVNRVTADLANFTQHPGDRGEVQYRNVSGTDEVKAPSYVLDCSIEENGALQI